MPSYDLKCEACSHKFSVFCSMSDKDRQTCPQCGSTEISQRFTGFNVNRGAGAGTASDACASCCPQAGGCPHKH